MATKSIQQIRKEQSDFHNACVNGDLKRILQKDSSYSVGKERQLQEFDMRLKLGKEPRIAYDVNFVMADDVRQLYESLLESYLTTLRNDLKRVKGIATETEIIQQKIRNVETRIQVSHTEKQRREEQKAIEAKQMESAKKVSNILAAIGFVIILAFIAYIVPYFIPEEKDPWVNQVNGQPIVCRHSGCGKTPINHEWEIRYCREHIQGTKYCRYPSCMNEIPNSSKERYCYKHR